MNNKWIAFVVVGTIGILAAFIGTILFFVDLVNRDYYRYDVYSQVFLLLAIFLALVARIVQADIHNKS